MRSFYHLSGQRVPIVFGPGRHPTSGARFLYFKGPDGTVLRILRRRRRDRRRGHAPATAIRLRANQSLHVGLQVCWHALTKILKSTITQIIRRKKRSGSGRNNMDLGFELRTAIVCTQVTLSYCSSTGKLSHELTSLGTEYLCKTRTARLSQCVYDVHDNLRTRRRIRCDGSEGESQPLRTLVNAVLNRYTVPRNDFRIVA